VLETGDVERVKAAMALSPDVKNMPLNRFGWNAPHIAVEHHHLPLLKYFVEDGTIDIRHVDNANSTLLHHALHFVSTPAEWEIVKYLLDSKKFKFDTMKDDQGNTTLHLAFGHCSIKQIAELNPYYKGSKDVFQLRNNAKQTPLMILKERVKGNADNMAVVERLQADIEGPEVALTGKWGAFQSDGKAHRFTGRPRGYVRAKMKAKLANSMKKSEGRRGEAPPPSAAAPSSTPTPAPGSGKSLSDSHGHGGGGSGHGKPPPAKDSGKPGSAIKSDPHGKDKKEKEKEGEKRQEMEKKAIAEAEKEAKMEMAEMKANDSSSENEKEKKEEKKEEAAMAMQKEEQKEMEEEEERDAADSMCENCDTGAKAIRFCEDCDSTFCKSCLVSHSQLKVTQDHSVIAVMGQCLSCDAGNKATSYCQDCKCDICDVCVADHKRLKVTQEHKVISLGEKRGLGISNDFVPVSGGHMDGEKAN